MLLLQLFCPHVSVPEVAEVREGRQSTLKVASITLLEFSKNELQNNEGLPRHRRPSAEGFSW